MLRVVDVEGTVDGRFAPVREAFEAVLASQRGTGAALAAWCDGAWVVDLWGGTADAAGDRPWRADSIAQPYSVTKPFAAVCALRLVDRGVLDLDAPVQRHWPEFLAPATVRQVLSHQAGVVALDEPVPTEVFYDWDRMCALLAAQPPQWPPGEAHGESALFYGHLVGELVRRVDGRRPGAFLRDEICEPLALDFHVGLGPGELARAVDLTGFGPDFERGSALGRPAMYGRAIDNPPGTRDPAVVNGERWRTAEIPAVNGHGTARGVAGLYAALLDGRVLSPDLLREATTAQCAGTDAVFGHDNAWGLGFALDGDDYGMGGLGGSYGGAAPAGGYAFGFVTGTMGTDDRALELENALRACLGMPELE
jgi:CubicO group peptidase (beta-lactamase class C family)